MLKETPYFHDTIQCTPEQLDLFKSQAKTQEEKILELFKRELSPLAWFEVKELLSEEMNDCSIKRCLSNLKEKGELSKTEIKVNGKWGKPCYKYQINLNK